MKDKSFDDLAGRFHRNIYGTRKGEIRFAILWQHLRDKILNTLPKAPLEILDAGCGMGQVSHRLLETGHNVTLCDVSSEMLEMAQTEIPSSFHGKADFIHSSFQSLPKEHDGRYDLVICHAVLEWMSEPDQAIKHLSRLTRPNGSLSLMFYNQDALVFRNLIRGNWKKVQSGKLAGEPGGLTPINPIDQYQVSDWLNKAGFSVTDSIGLRCFFDYLPKAMQQERALADILELERQFSTRSPYKELARYLHVHAVKKPE